MKSNSLRASHVSAMVSVKAFDGLPNYMIKSPELRTLDIRHEWYRMPDQESANTYSTNPIATHYAT